MPGVGSLRAVVALGSNRCHGRHGRPEAILRAAMDALAAGGFEPIRRAPIISTAPLGPSNRRFANGAVLGRWHGTPAELLALCKDIEHRFGRRRTRRWAARVLDLDVILVEQMEIAAPELRLPHYAMADRRFVLEPLATIWPDWRHPGTHKTVRQMLALLRKPRPCDAAATACR